MFTADWGYGRSTGFRGLVHDKVPEIERWLSSQAFINCSMCLGRTVTNNVIDLHVRGPFSHLLRTKANQIEPADIQRILARLVQLGKTRQVNKLRSYLHAAFTHGGKHDNDPRQMTVDSVTFNLSSNPAVLVPRIAEFDRAGDRVLSELELRLFWESLNKVTAVPACFLRFNLALGGQRIEQLLRVNWTDFDFEQGGFDTKRQ